METMEFAIDTINRNARTALIRTWLQDKTFRITLAVLLTLSLSRSHKQLSLLFTIQFLWCYDGVGSTNNPIIDILLYSHHLTAWYCIDIVRRNSVLVTCKSERVNAMKTHLCSWPALPPTFDDLFIHILNPFSFWREGFNRFEKVSTGLNPSQNKDRTELNHNFIKAKIIRRIKKLNGQYDMKWEFTR